MARHQIIRYSILGSLMLTSALTACNPPGGPGGGSSVNAQGQTSASLELRFQIPEQQPAYLAQVQEIEVRVFSRGQQTLSDRFDFALASSSSEVRRSIENVPTGSIEVQIRLLDNQGEPLQSLSSQFEFKSSSEAVLVELNQTAMIIPPVALTGSLSDLRQQRLQTLNEIQSLGKEESRLQIQVRGLVNAQTPEDKVIREQYQAELQTAQSRLRLAESTLASQNAALQRLEAQSTTGGSVAIDTGQLLALRQQSDSLRSEIEALMNQRRQLNSELRNADGSRQDQIQGELQNLNLQIDAKITALSTISQQLLALESILSGQSVEQVVPNNPAELVQLNQQIVTLEAEIATFKQQLEVLQSQTDFQSVQRRERFEADLAGKQADLVQARERKKQLEN